MRNIDLIATLAADFGAALGLGYLTHRLGWSPLVGYLLAGILVGPNTPGFVANRELAGQLAEVGVILLMFGVGMRFRLKELLAVRGIAIPGALVQSATATTLGAILFHALGVGWTSGIVLGLALSVASTVVLIRILSGNAQLQSPAGRIAVGWLITEDLLVVFILVLLPALLGSAPASVPLPVSFFLAAGKIAAFGGFTLWIGGRFIPWLLNGIAETRSRELFTLTVLAVALGIAVSASMFFGVSMALGAFLAGMVVGHSDFSARAASEAIPMRDAFAVMFFLSVGLLFDPRQIGDAPLLAAGALAIVLICKPVFTFLIVTLLGYGSKVGFGVALSLAQVGEFSFLLAVVGRELGALDAAAMNALISAAILSILLNPTLCKAVTPLESLLRRRRRAWRLFNRRSAMPSSEPSCPAPPGAALRAVVVGYGPVGRMITRILRDRGIAPIVIELNMETYRELRAEGIDAVYGDAASPDVLAKAGIASAFAFILSASGSTANCEAVRIAREQNGAVHIVARSDYLSDAPLLTSSGADKVFVSEAEVALAIAESILRELGTTPGQLDEAMARIRLRLSHPRES